MFLAFSWVLFYLILPFNFTSVQLADISSAGQSDKQQQNKSLFSSKLLQFTGSSTHPKTYRRKQKTKNLELYKDPKKFNFFKNCNSVALKTLKTMIRCDISGSMRRLTFRRSRLKTKSSHTEQWLPLNNMKVYGLNIRGVITSGPQTGGKQ